MKVILLLLIFISSFISASSQTYELRTVYFDITGGQNDSVFLKQNTDSLFRRTNGTIYTYATRERVKYFTPASVLTGTTIPTNTTQLTNGSGYITPTALTPYLTTAQASLLYQVAGSYALSNHTHAYNTLTGLPTIPTNTNQLTNGALFLVAADIVGKTTGGAAHLTSNFTTSSTTAVNTPLTFTIAANEKYVIVIDGTASKATTATGMKVAIAAPVGCTISGMQYAGAALIATPLVPSLFNAANTLAATFATGIGVVVGYQLHITVTNGVNAGNITLQCATVTSNVASILAGTSMTWIKSTNL